MENCETLEIIVNTSSVRGRKNAVSKIKEPLGVLMEQVSEPRLKAHCHGADWINQTIKKKRIRQGSGIWLYSEIHEDDNDLIPFILETKYDP